MRPQGALAALLVLASLAASSAAAPPSPEQTGKPAPVPVVQVDPSGFDFGRAQPGKTLKKEFTLRNAGEAPLVLQGVSTSCGCTAAIPGATRLSPGQSTPLTVTLETRSYRGPLERRVIVRSNDPKTPLLEIKVKVTVEPPAMDPK